MVTYRTPNEQDENYVIEFVCPGELVPIVLGAIEDQTQLNDFRDFGDLSPEEVAQGMGLVFALAVPRILPGGFLTDIHGNVLTDIYGRLIYGGVTPTIGIP